MLAADALAGVGGETDHADAVGAGGGQRDRQPLERIGYDREEELVDVARRAKQQPGPLDRRAASHAEFSKAPGFAVNVLRCDHEPLARWHRRSPSSWHFHRSSQALTGMGLDWCFWLTRRPDFRLWALVSPQGPAAWGTSQLSSPRVQCGNLK